MANTIEQVRDNSDKRETYAYLLGKYKKALREQFYFEALIIVYAMIEDRLRSILYYYGIFDGRNSKQVSNKTKQHLKWLFQQKYGENEKVRLHTITGKIKVVRAILEWAENANANTNRYSEYLHRVKELTETLDVMAITDLLHEVDAWLKFRNEVIHASMNKNLQALYAGIDEKIEIGMRCARELDAHVKTIKKTNIVRKGIGID